MEGTEGIPDDYVIACGDWYLKQFYGFSFKDTDVMEKMKENERKNDKILSFLDEKYEILTKNPTEHRMDLSI